MCIAEIFQFLPESRGEAPEQTTSSSTRSRKQTQGGGSGRTSPCSRLLRMRNKCALNHVVRLSVVEVGHSWFGNTRIFPRLAMSKGSRNTRKRRDEEKADRMNAKANSGWTSLRPTPARSRKGALAPNDHRQTFPSMPWWSNARP